MQSGDYPIYQSSCIYYFFQFVAPLQIVTIEAVQQEVTRFVSGVMEKYNHRHIGGHILLISIILNVKVSMEHI
jgi:hypothetical protein